MQSRIILLLVACGIPFTNSATTTVYPGSGTLSRAISDAAPGEVLLLEDGTYTAADGAPISTADAAASAIRVDRPLTIRAKNLHMAVVDGEGKRGVMLISATAKEMTIEGLHITGGYTNSFDGDGAGVKWAYGNVMLRSNKFSMNQANLGACHLYVSTDIAMSSACECVDYSELYNNTFESVSWTISNSVSGDYAGDCRSGLMTSINAAVRNRCVTLGMWTTPNPSSTPPTTFTGCRFKCDAGTYGASESLTESSCTDTCPIGHFCTQGSSAPGPCPKDSYMDATGATTCIRCPAFAETTGTGATSIAMCKCSKGFYADFIYKAADDAGSMVCSACPEGSTTITAGATSVEQCICQQGRFLSIHIDDATCPQCKDELAWSTTIVAGATSVEACDCIEGYYLEANATSRSCVACDLLLMDCSIPGITLANMPIKPGGWRLSNSTSIVRECFNPDACVGNPGVAGSNATQRRRLSAGASTSTAGDDLCAPGHAGFLCGTCGTDWCDAFDAPSRSPQLSLPSHTRLRHGSLMCAEASA